MKANVITTTAAAHEKGCTSRAILHAVKSGRLNAVHEPRITLVLRDATYAAYRPRPRRRKVDLHV